jgi:hypothetical protein
MVSKLHLISLNRAIADSGYRPLRRSKPVGQARILQVYGAAKSGSRPRTQSADKD